MWWRSLVMILVVFISGCALIEEEDLSKRVVTLNAPADSLQTEIFTHTFWWEEVEGATNYNIQIVKPDFEAIERLIADSLINRDKFTITLAPGTYQWRVRAENTTSFTDFQTRTLIIDSTTNLENQTIVLVAPTENFITNKTEIFFQWQDLAIADEYRLEIYSPDISSGTLEFSDVIMDDTITLYNFSEGDFEWRVRGQNATSNTLYSSRSFTVDTSSPSAPVLISPADNAQLTLDTITLMWTSDLDVFTDTVFVYTDTIGQQPLVESSSNTRSFKFTGVDGSYSWQVKSIDEAGNESPLSARFSFTKL